MTPEDRKRLEELEIKFNAGSPFVYPSIEWLCSQLRAAWSREERMREVLEEFTLPPYHDSNLESLLLTLRTRASYCLRELSRTSHGSGGEKME